MKKLMFATAALVSLAGSAYAADIPAMPVKARPVVVVDPGWEGFYIGGNAGYSWGRARTDQRDTVTSSSITECFRSPAAGEPPVTGALSTTVCAPNTATVFPVTTAAVSTTALTTGTADVDGFIGGGQIGYNWKRDQWLFGLEADIQYSDQKGSYSACSVAGCPAGSAFGAANHHLKWFGTFRGRVGWLPTNSLLLYATGGLVYGQFASDYLSGINGGTILAASTSTTRAGWTVGAGAEGRLSNEWSVKIEYLYADYGNFDAALGTSAAVTTTGPFVFTTSTAGTRTTTTTTVSPAVSTNFIDHIIRVGVNYRFAGTR